MSIAPSISIIINENNSQKWFMMIQNFNICVTKQDFEILFSIQKIFMAAAIKSSSWERDVGATRNTIEGLRSVSESGSGSRSGLGPCLGSWGRFFCYAKYFRFSIFHFWTFTNTRWLPPQLKTLIPNWLWFHVNCTKIIDWRGTN